MVSKDLVPKSLRECGELKRADIAYQEYEPGGSMESHSHTDFEHIYYFITGKGFMKVGDEEIIVRPGTVVSMPLNTPHSLRNTGEEPLGHLIFVAYTK